MFQIKIYNSANITLIRTISPKDIISDISFTMDINWWHWEQSIELAYKIDDNTISLWDIVKITMFNDNNKSWKQIYMWTITRIWRKQTETRQTIVLTCLWVSSLLVDDEFRKNYSWNSWDIIRSLIDQYNSSYANIFTYTSSSIDDWIAITGEETWTYLWLIASISKRTWYYFYIDWEWVVWYKQKPTTPTHYLTNKKDVQEFIVNEDIESLINSVKAYWKYNEPVSPWIWIETFITSDYEDAASISTYWKKHWKVEIRTGSQTYLDNYAIQYVNNNKTPKSVASIIVNRKYNIESIKPWDTIKIKNFEYNLSNLQIMHINYTPDTATLSLWEYKSFWWEIIKQKNPL